ncbi:snoRNP assembly factor Naf1, putative [Blumeria hordei DH14]|uniref:H/ACA ribonucleoprotein complex non-core subunit NAF1 n=1 Tax=Blumeria graminis f. sp. hordei (strain DH14) TaxID=546991 RepID=N1J514_BLUG1|nr:snoRNP assembly factor Naf1, putative [Blumeria hordei DH14]
MAGDGGSDDEGGDKSKSSGGQLRTKNEIPEVVIPRPDIVITQDMPIIELGVVEQIVDNVLLIKANTSGEYRVLESGSILCLPDRRVIGVVAETIGRVEQPFYSVLFTNSAEILALGISMGIKVFYSESHSTYVFTKSLKVFKGSDASNMNDEEVGEDEVEFSDDEMEAEHKRRVKQKRMGKREGKFQAKVGSTRNAHSLQQMSALNEKNSVQSISYDEDEPYKPLTRPIGYAEHVSQNEAPLDNAYTGDSERQYSKGQSKSRSRGERRRARGDNGRARGDRNSRTPKASLPTKEPYQQSYGQISAPRPQTSSMSHSHDDNIAMQNITPQFPFYPLPQSTSSSAQPPENLSHQIASQPHMQPHLQSHLQNHMQSHLQPHLQPHLQLWSQIFSQQGSQQPSPNTNQNWANLVQSLPTGGYVNPAFFTTQNGLSQPWKPPNHQDPSNSQGN